uniref:Transmembrane protein n=1 Tax=Fagus sylvatica TaxID=28930 RepID=A0A2N9FPU0_FAGSY
MASSSEVLDLCCRHGFGVGWVAGVGVGLLLVVLPAWVWVCCWWCCRRGCVGLMVVLPAWVGGFDGGAAGVGVGLMVELPA